jgi:hypothetical protein
MRTSSMSPANGSSQIVLPPIRSGFADVVIGPVCARWPTCAPLTKKRSVAPS